MGNRLRQKVKKGLRRLKRVDVIVGISTKDVQTTIILSLIHI